MGETRSIATAWILWILLAGCTELVTASERPSAIVRVSPPEGSAGVVEVVSVELDFTRATQADPSSVRLQLDGIDVTEQSSVGGSRDWPPSSLEIAYVAKDMPSGPHRAEVSFESGQGARARYEWSFRVERKTSE